METIIKHINALVTTTNEARPLELIQIPLPELGDHDLLVKVMASGVNPVDAKQRSMAVAAGATRVLGFDGVGEVVGLGEKVADFNLGDRVFYAGQLSRTGSNAEYQLVDARIAARAPETVSVEAAAAMPLTFLTAYELLHDHFNIKMEAQAARGKRLLIINGAGGVGSVMIQLAKWLGMEVIASASRPETVAWVEQMGADHVINHRDDYVPLVKSMGLAPVDYLAILHTPEPHIEAAAELIAPFGHIGAIVEPAAPLEVRKMKNKAASLDWEFMFAKTNADFEVASQGKALALLQQLIDSAQITTTLTERVHGLDAETIREAQDRVASGKVMGKLVAIFD